MTYEDFKGRMYRAEKLPLKIPGVRGIGRPIRPGEKHHMGRYRTNNPLMRIK